MKIKDVMRKIRNIACIMVHDGNGGSMCMNVDELDESTGELEFEWFEVTSFLGGQCIEFTIQTEEEIL